ncbi:cyanophycin synthetase [Fodinicurvata halophila]|uniref:Cyanophycin synthetase n=1 Tax=Fodinicurvata halophila TaxID=1419723 RepID=A0ABV8UH58_9PROT
MKIMEHRALRGPNYYSRYLTIFMRLDIEELEQKPSDQAPGIAERLQELMPGIYEHRCSVGEPGGFLQRVERGTYAGHMVEHVAIELQNMIGFSVGYGKTVDSYETGIYIVCYRYRDEACGLAAGREAVDIVERLYTNQDVDLESIIARLKEVRDAHMLGPSTASIVEAAKRRNIPYFRLSEDTSYIQLGHGSKQKRFQATVTENTGIIGHGIADDKDWTKQILGDAGIPVPRGQICNSLQEALEAADEIGYPLATKPLVGNHGRGVSTNITKETELRDAYAAALARHESVVVEQFVRGEDHRLLVIDGKLIAAARRRPAHVTGDGKTSLRKLIERENQDPRRGVGHENLLTQIHVDEQTERLISQAGLTMDSVITEGEVVYLKSTANLSTGGTATDLTDDVHPEVAYAAERISRLIGLDIIGIDLLAETLTKPLEEQSAGVVEVNAGPGFRMHTSPTHGQGRDVGQHVLNMLFPMESEDGRIPITAITGTNGKTTTTRLVSHLLRQAGRRVGMACTGTIEIDNHVVMRGDYSGPQAASTVLKEPGVENAVLEVARGGILRRGLGFDSCDVGILLNIASDHLGEGDIHTLDELARCKTVVVDAVSPEGTCVLNADDPRVLDQGTYWSRGKIIYFTMNPDFEPVQKHVANHGVAFTVRDDFIVMRQGQVEAEVIHVNDVPITFEGHAPFNIQNALAAAAAGYALGLNMGDIKMGLQTFHPTPGQLPGRVNLVEADGVKCLIDYGHNVPALKALETLVFSLGPKQRISVASAPGNRRNEDLEALGAQLAHMHSRLFICETDPRGRPVGEAASLMQRGAENSGKGCQVEVVMEERAAIEQAVDAASEGDLLVLLVDDIDYAIERLKGRSFQDPPPNT